jgi:hypothetical protein
MSQERVAAYIEEFTVDRVVYIEKHYGQYIKFNYDASFRKDLLIIDVTFVRTLEERDQFHLLWYCKLLINEKLEALKTVDTVYSLKAKDTINLNERDELMKLHLGYVNEQFKKVSRMRKYYEEYTIEYLRLVRN